jgi:hypothetical protein
MLPSASEQSRGGWIKEESLLCHPRYRLNEVVKQQNT